MAISLSAMVVTVTNASRWCEIGGWLSVCDGC